MLREVFTYLGRHIIRGLSLCVSHSCGGNKPKESTFLALNRYFPLGMKPYNPFTMRNNNPIS